MRRKKSARGSRARKPGHPKDGQAPPAAVGDEAVGGSVGPPDQDRVDDVGNALGVPRAPDDEVRTSGEILEGREGNRWEQEP